MRISELWIRWTNLDKDKMDWFFVLFDYSSIAVLMEYTVIPVFVAGSHLFKTFKEKIFLTKTNWDEFDFWQKHT